MLPALPRPRLWLKLCPVNDEATGSTRLVKPRPQQRQVLDAIETHNRVIVTKYRQSYSTTAAATWMYGDVMYHPGWRGALVADQQDTAEEAFSMITLAYDGQPASIKVSALRSGTRHLVFSNGSRLKVLYATAERLGIGRSIDRLVLTEFGLWPNAEVGMQRLSPTYRKRKHAKVLIESTPGQKGCLMENMVVNAIAGKGDWHNVFLRWWLDRYCSSVQPVGWQPDNTEIDYINGHPGMTIGHAWFRRMMLEGEMRGDTRLFDNQFPPSELGGFTVLGSPAIPLDAVQAQLDLATSPIPTGDLLLVSDRRSTDRYLIVADPAGFGATGDPSAITLWDLVTHRLIGYWSERTDPGSLADRIMRLQRWYCAEVVAVESNSSACIQALVDRGCIGLYHTSREHPGFYMDIQSKREAITRAVDLLRKGWEIRAREVLMQLYSYTDSNRVQRVAGHHWDLAITVFIAAYIMADGHWSPKNSDIRTTPIGVTYKDMKRLFKRAG